MTFDQALNYYENMYSNMVYMEVLVKIIMFAGMALEIGIFIYLIVKVRRQKKEIQNLKRYLENQKKEVQ